MEMDYEQGRINNYDWNEPVSKHLEIAYEALQRCIVNNFSPFPTYNPKMTVARHRKTDRRPEAFINKDKESIGLGVAGDDGYWTDGSMSLKDLVNMWNKAQEIEKKDEKKDGSWSPLGLREEMLSFAGKSLPECADMVCDALKKELRSITENVGRRLLAPEHILSKIDSVEYIKARIDRRIAVIKDDGLREDYLMWLAEDIILLVIAMRKKEAGEAE